MTEFVENIKPKGKKQTVFRNASPTNPYAQIPNATLRDKDLTPGAGWLLMLCLSMRQDWTASTEQMAKLRGMNRETVKRHLRELEDLGFCKRVRRHDNLGKFGGYEFWFSDSKGYFSTDDEQKDEPSMHLPSLGFASDGVLTPYKKTTVSQEDYQSKKTKNNDDASRTDGALPTATAQLGASVFSPSVLRKIQDLGVKTEPLIERYFAKTKLKPVRNPSAYLLRMAKEEAADRDGVALGVVDALVHGQPAEKARALGAVLRTDRVLPDWQRRSATNPNRSALAGTSLLKGGKS